MTTDQTWAQQVEEIGSSAFQSIKEMVEALKQAKTDKEREEAEQTIQEDPLSLEVRSGWYRPGEQGADEPGEYCILLSTGGPATRIIGRLNEYQEPQTACLQVQDWFKPWTPYPCDESVLLTYAQQFYYGG